MDCEQHNSVEGWGNTTVNHTQVLTLAAVTSGTWYPELPDLSICLQVRSLHVTSCSLLALSPGRYPSLGRSYQ